MSNCPNVSYNVSRMYDVCECSRAFLKLYFSKPGMYFFNNNNYANVAQPEPVTKNEKTENKPHFKRKPPKHTCAVIRSMKAEPLSEPVAFLSL